MESNETKNPLQKIITNSGSEKREGGSKEQKNFQHLLEKIQHLKNLIEEKKQLSTKFSSLNNEQLNPLIKQLCDVKLSQLRTLQYAFERNRFSKRLKTRLKEEIAERINELLAGFDLTDEQQKEVTAIYAFHSGTNAEELEQDLKEKGEEATRDFLWSEFGIELDENESADMSDPEVAARIRARIAENAKQQSHQHNEKNKKVNDLQDKLSKSIRSVYTSLVKFLHPDKELDETKKIEKTEAIKEVTAAYESKDMLALLVLQSKYGVMEEHLDESILKTYNSVLKKQIADLEYQHQTLSNPMYGGIPVKNETALAHFINAEKKNLKHQIKQEKTILSVYFEDEDLLAEYLQYYY
jgi:hypothetical protein